MEEAREEAAANAAKRGLQVMDGPEERADEAGANGAGVNEGAIEPQDGEQHTQEAALEAKAKAGAKAGFEVAASATVSVSAAAAAAAAAATEVGSNWLSCLPPRMLLAICSRLLDSCDKVQRRAVEVLRGLDDDECMAAATTSAVGGKGGKGSGGGAHKTAKTKTKAKAKVDKKAKKKREAKGKAKGKGKGADGSKGKGKGGKKSKKFDYLAMVRTDKSQTKATGKPTGKLNGITRTSADSDDSGDGAVGSNGQNGAGDPQANSRLAQGDEVPEVPLSLSLRSPLSLPAEDYSDLPPPVLVEVLRRLMAISSISSTSSEQPSGGNGGSGPDADQGQSGAAMGANGVNGPEQADARRAKDLQLHCAMVQLVMVVQSTLQGPLDHVPLDRDPLDHGPLTRDSWCHCNFINYFQLLPIIVPVLVLDFTIGVSFNPDQHTPPPTTAAQQEDEDEDEDEEDDEEGEDEFDVIGAAVGVGARSKGVGSKYFDSSVAPFVRSFLDTVELAYCSDEVGTPSPIQTMRRITLPSLTLTLTFTLTFTVIFTLALTLANPDHA